MCTVPGLAPATNYTVSVTALSDAGTGAGSEEIEQMTDLGELCGTCTFNTAFVILCTLMYCMCLQYVKLEAVTRLHCMLGFYFHLNPSSCIWCLLPCPIACGI